MELKKFAFLFSCICFCFVLASSEGIVNQVFLDDSSTFRVAQNDAGHLLIEIKAFGQTFILELTERDEFFNETLTDSKVSYLRGNAFSGNDKIGLAFGEFRRGEFYTSFLI